LDERAAPAVPARRLCLGSGTKSMPPGCQGAHFSSRRTASQVPRTAPCTCSASTAYSLQVGMNRQRGGRVGLIARW